MTHKSQNISTDINYDPIYDRTDTVSIASIESSIFDLDSSYSSYHFEKNPNSKKSGNIYPFKTKPFKLHEKIPENWLYIPKQIKEEPSNPNEVESWIRGVFESDKLPDKGNLKQKLSKSQNDLNLIYETKNIESKMSSLGNYNSTSDLKNMLLTNENSTSHPVSKTAPGSTENIADNTSRTNYRDILALAKEQEDKLKAEVMKRRKESLQNNHDTSLFKPTMTVKNLKSKRISVPINRFGFNHEQQQQQKCNAIIPPKQQLVTTKYTPKLSLNNSRMPTLANKSNNSQRSLSASSHVRRSVDSNNSRNIRVFHV